MSFRNICKHFILVCNHKRYVFKYCRKAGLFWKGFKHDFSKFSPVEFWESVKYFTGTHSPIDECKKKNGYSKAWLHHKGRNSHHYEYWQDNFDKGGVALQMPFEDALEMICDFLGAGHAYSKKNFTYQSEYEWWQNKKKNPLAMHPQTKAFVEIMLKQMLIENSNDCLRKQRAKFYYDLTSALEKELKYEHNN